MATKTKKTGSPATAADELLRGLAQTDDDHALVRAILAKAKVGPGTLKVGKRTVRFGPPGDPAAFADWPASFRELIAKTGAIAIGDALVIGVDADGGLDSLPYLTRGTELEGKEADVRCPVEEMPNWWIYHPLDRAPSGEPRLRFLDHAGGNFSKSAFDHIGSLAIDRIAAALGVEATAPADDRELVVKSLGKLHKSVNDARVRGKVLFTLERPLKKELWGDYPDAVARVAAYDLSKPAAPALLSFLPTTGVPARMTLDGDHLIVLTVDWDASTFELLEIDAADPAAMRVAATIHSAQIPANRSFNDCEKDSGVLVTADGRLLVNYYFNHRELCPLHVFERAAGAWQHVSEHAFDGVESKQPFAEVVVDGKVVADPDALWRLFDRHWGRVAIVGERAVIRDREDDGTAFRTVDRAGAAGKPLRLSKDDLSVELAVMNDCVVASSGLGVLFLRVLADGSLVKSKALKRASPKEVIWTGGYLLINDRFDKAKPVAKGFCLDICAVT